MKSSLMLFAALAFASPALANDEAPKSDVSRTAANVDPERVRCVRITETGSRVRASKVCKTNAEWNRLADAGNKQATDIVEAGRIASIQGQ